MIFGHPPAPKGKYAYRPDELWQRIVSEAITHGTTMAFNDQLLTTEVCEAEARQKFRKRTHTDQDDALLVLRECVETARALGGIKDVKVPMKSVTLNDIWDGAKKTMREQRIARNQVAESRVCGPVGREEYFRWLREERLANAIERTQLPHEMTIHERIMPYRVKE